MGVSFNPRNRKCLNRNFGPLGVYFASSIILYEVWVKEQLIAEAKNHGYPILKKQSSQIRFVKSNQKNLLFMLFYYSFR